VRIIGCFIGIEMKSAGVSVQIVLWWIRRSRECFRIAD
jgi:hypothetical protein